MKKVLIIAYFFPPCNLAGANRPYGWAKYLKEHGYQPIIITRNWDIPLTLPEDAYRSCGNETIHEVNENYEAYYLPYKSNLRDRIFVKYKYREYNFIRKTLTFLEMLIQNFTIKIVPFKNIYYFTKEYIKNNPDIKIVITTGNPFIVFKFGYLLKRKLNISWIADYRDDWNTNSLKRKQNIPDYLLSIVDSYSEKKWIGYADTFISVSEKYVEKIAKFTNNKGHTISNGFIEEEYSNDEKPFDYFSIVYNGTLYESQNIECFISSYKKIIDNYKHKVPIKMCFLGLGYDKIQVSRIQNILKGYEDYYEITNRIPKHEVIKYMLKSTLLLMISHEDIKGVPSSKLYQYIRCYKNILLCPTDHDIMEYKLIKSGLGQICYKNEDGYSILEKLILEYIEKGSIAVHANYEYINQFSRKEQTKKLANILNIYSK